MHPSREDGGWKVVNHCVFVLDSSQQGPFFLDTICAIIPKPRPESFDRVKASSHERWRWSTNSTVTLHGFIMHRIFSNDCWRSRLKLSLKLFSLSHRCSKYPHRHCPPFPILVTILLYEFAFQDTYSTAKKSTTIRKTPTTFPIIINFFPLKILMQQH